MQKPILVANWKNYPESLPAAGSLVSTLARKARLYKKLSFFIAPPYTYFETVSKKIKSLGSLASQDISLIMDNLAHTGEVTPTILKSFGTKLVIIGHSERRQLGETNEIVASKVKIALQAGIIPLICVGERVRDTEGRYFEYLREQIKQSLDGIKNKDATKVIVAYEPVWAVGKQAKGVIPPEDLAQMTIFIKKALTDIYDRKTAEKVSILYGGSVDEDNAQVLMKVGKVKGLLIGRASLDGKRFSKIAETLIS